MKNKKKKSMTHMVEKYLQKNCPSEMRWCLYKDTQNILGKTFDICIFQDYEYLTPNIIARGMETVAGGGFIIFLAPSMMDLESYFNTSQNTGINAISNSNRFLKRFTVSLNSSKFCICLDDAFNLLNKKKKAIKFKESGKKKDNTNLISLKEHLKLSESAFYPLVNICATFDQTRCLKNLCNSIKMFNHPSNKDDNDCRYSVVSTVTAARGRGKSAALGLALCAALQTGVSQICVTSPSPENIATLWQYVKLGLKALDYSEHIDFDITFSYLRNGVKAITKVELKKRNYTQVIRYIEPSETEAPDCDLLCIDEAAAIPLSTLQMYLRSFSGLVFISSTVSGYEGSGMALSTKLFEELRRSFTVMNTGLEIRNLSGNTRGRLYEITLEEPIRYGCSDPVEAYLYRTMCMNYKSGLPHVAREPLTPDKCQLMNINRDILFGCTKSSEDVLQQVMAIYSASNLQNSPDDLKNLADNGCTRLLCLTDSEPSEVTPTIIVIIQISYEGPVNRIYVEECLRSNGKRPVVDIVSSLLAHEYLEPRFSQLSGIRINMIATAPGLEGRGYGSRALSLLLKYTMMPPAKYREDRDHCGLLLPLDTLPVTQVNYVAMLGNLSAPLVRFMARASPQFVPVYLQATADEGQYRGVLIAQTEPSTEYLWLSIFRELFLRRFTLLTHGPYRNLGNELTTLIGCDPTDQDMDDVMN